MSATAASLAGKFSSPEYVSFKETVERASLDNKLVVKNKHIVFGKHKVQVPNFVSSKELIEYLESERVKYLLEYNDIYEKIIVSDKPQSFKASYEKLVTTISNLEILIDEIHTFIDGRNSHKRVDVVSSQLDDVANKIHKISLELQANGVLDTIKVKDLILLFHEELKLHATLSDAKQEPYMDYVIYDLPSTNKQSIVSTNRVSKRSGVTMLNKVKPSVKKLMIDKLDISI